MPTLYDRAYKATEGTFASVSTGLTFSSYSIYWQSCKFWSGEERQVRTKSLVQGNTTSVQLQTLQNVKSENPQRQLAGLQSYRELLLQLQELM